MHIQALVSADGILPGISSKHQLLFINLASVPGRVCHEKQDSEILFCNCIDDGSWPAVHAFQQECTNRLKVLCSKDKVLNVQVKRHRKVSGTCNGVECE